MGAPSAQLTSLPLGIGEAGDLRLVLFAQIGRADGGPFLLLRQHPEAAIFLGGLVDAAGMVHELLEVWNQRVSGLAACHPAAASHWTNLELDRRWAELRRQIATADGRATLRLAIEDAVGRPLWFDADMRPVEGADGWELCREDARLAERGLPTYGESRHRYLVNRESGEWVALSPDAPLDAGVQRLDEAFPGAACFNPEGGRIFCRPAGVIGWREFARCLDGEAWRPGLPGGLLDALPPVYQELAADREGDVRWRHFLVPRMGDRACLAELLYLRLALIHDAVGAVSAATANRGAPFLNLADEHFGIRLSDPGHALPALWTARVVLNRAGGAVPAETQTGERFFVADESAVPGPFRVPGWRGGMRARASFRVRKLGELIDGLAAVEGTLQSDDDLGGRGSGEGRMVVLGGHRLQLRIESPGGPLMVGGEITPGASARDWLFAGQAAAGVHAVLVEGATHPQVDVVVDPKLGPACDLYALGILGLGLLLGNSERSLASVADEVLQLRDQLPAATNADSMPGTLRERGADRSWLQPGGIPGVTPDDPLDSLWWEALACMIRMLGGAAPAFYWSDFGDGLGGDPAGVYRRPARDLAALTARGRMLVLGEGDRNCEMRREIESLIGELRDAAGTG